jgi:hypothetical protein
MKTKTNIANLIGKWKNVNNGGKLIIIHGNRHYLPASDDLGPAWLING